MRGKRPGLANENEAPTQASSQRDGKVRPLLAADPAEKEQRRRRLRLPPPRIELVHRDAIGDDATAGCRAVAGPLSAADAVEVQVEGFDAGKIRRIKFAGQVQAEEDRRLNSGGIAIEERAETVNQVKLLRASATHDFIAAIADEQGQFRRGDQL